PEPGLDADAARSVGREECTCYVLPDRHLRRACARDGTKDRFRRPSDWESLLVASEPFEHVGSEDSRRACTDQCNAGADHRCEGEIFPAALRRAPARGLSDRARTGSRARSLECDDHRLERAFLRTNYWAAHY